MTPRLLYLFLLLSLPWVGLYAQTSSTDSIKAVSQAKTDADNFKLNKADLKQFRKHRSDYMLQYSPNRNPFSGPPNLFKAPVLPSGVKKMKDGYNQVDRTADYFKPSKTTTTDTTLLNDSVYVKAFRSYAYNRTAARRTAGALYSYL